MAPALLQPGSELAFLTDNWEQGPPEASFEQGCKSSTFGPDLPALLGQGLLKGDHQVFGLLLSQHWGAVSPPWAFHGASQLPSRAGSKPNGKHVLS